MVNRPGRIVVLGIGNLLMHDDGVGIHLIRKLEAEFEFQPEIELIDGGTMGGDLLPYFEAERILIVDAVNFDREPGYVGTLANDEILTRLTTKLSMHHLGLTDVLSQVKLLGLEPSDIFLVGIQPQSYGEMNIELSDPVASGLERMINIVCDKLQEWGVSCQPKNQVVLE